MLICLMCAFVGCFFNTNYIHAADDPYLNDLRIRDQYKENIHNLFVQGDFNQLEQIMKQAKELNDRFASGSFKLDYFYRGIALNIDDFYIEDFDEPIALLKEWIEEFPNSVTPKIALSHMYRNLAWKHRGSTVSADVTESGYDNFNTILGQSEDLLKEAQKLDDKDPALYVVWIGVNTGLGGLNAKDNVYDLVKKTMAIDSQYYMSYIYASTTLLPRWHGDKGEVETFAASIADQTSDEMYMRIAVAVREYTGEDGFLKFNFDWKRVHNGFKEVHSQYKSLYYLNNYAWYSAYEKDQDLAKSLFAVIGDKWDSDAQKLWKSKKRFAAYKHWASTGQDYPKKEVTTKNGKYEGIYETYDDKTKKTTMWLYEDGKLNGNTKAYNEDGSIYGSWMYKDGVYVGQGPY